jgi:hypothetical protein
MAVGIEYGASGERGLFTCGIACRCRTPELADCAACCCFKSDSPRELTKGLRDCSCSLFVMPWAVIASTPVPVAPVTSDGKQCGLN